MYSKYYCNIVSHDIIRLEKKNVTKTKNTYIGMFSSQNKACTTIK